MKPAFREQIDVGILDEAAALFARRGYEQTSVQAVADAVGLSKAGLLHHFPSKDSLRGAVVTQCVELTDRALEQVVALAPGPARDRRAVEVLADLALAQPGVVAFALGSATASGPGAPDEPATDLAQGVFAVFGIPGGCADGAERYVRVVGAMSALAVLSLAAHHAGQAAAWRRFVIDTSYDALGHPAAAPETSQEH